MLGGFALFPRFSRSSIPPIFHRWGGRVYVVAAVVTGVVGLVYVVVVGSVGGIIMVCFEFIERIL